MTKSKKLNLYFILISILFCFSLFLFGCGNEAVKINTTYESIPTGYQLETDEFRVSKGSSHIIHILAEQGYKLDDIIVKVNDSVVNGYVSANINGEDVEVNDETGIYYNRTWTYKINKVEVNTNIDVDLSLCGIMQRTLTLSGLENQNAFYAKSIANDVKIKTNFNSNVITNKVPVFDNNFEINFGDGIYLFLDNDIDLIISSETEYFPVGSLKRYGDVPYKYYKQHVYYLGNIIDNTTVRNRYQSIVDESYAPYKTANIWIDRSTIVSLDYRGASLSNETLTVLTGERFSDTYMYIGDKNTFQEEDIYNNLDASYLNVLGKKAFYRIHLSAEYETAMVEDIADFYLVNNPYVDITNLTPVSINRDEVSAYIEINKADIEQFINDDIAHVLLKTVIKEDILKSDLVGFKLNYENNDSVTGIMKGSYASYYEYTSDTNIIYYFKKSVFSGDNSNHLEISIGTSNIHEPYFIPKIESVNFVITKLNDSTSIFDKTVSYTEPVFADYVALDDYVIELDDNEKNVFVIDIKTNFENKETSLHAISFDNLFNDINELTQTVFISNNITASNWIEVKQENLTQLNELNISITSPLYYYIVGEDYSSLQFHISYNETNISNESIAIDILCNAINVEKGNSYYAIYALYLEAAYLPAEVELSAGLNDEL